MVDQQSSLNQALLRCGLLAGVTLCVWVLLLLPAWSMAGVNGLEGLSYAALLCLLPGWLVFLVSSRYRVASTQAAVIALGGSVGRMLFVLLGTLLIQSLREQLRFREFVVWLLVFYLTTLTVETLLVLKQMSQKNGDVPAP